MAKFKNKKGGVCEVFSAYNIEMLRKDKNYTEISDKNEKKAEQEKTPEIIVENKKETEKDS